MIVYNITIKVSWQIQPQWLSWMQSTHINNYLQTNCFSHYYFMKLVTADDDEGATYALQLHCESKAIFNSFLDKFDKQLSAQATTQWQQNYMAFKTIMQQVL